MKILHTSDLHLGHIWRGKSRKADHYRVLDEILGLCNQHQADALLITGDIFADRIEGGKPSIVARLLLERLRPLLEQDRAVFLLRGNHDPLDLFQLMRVLTEEVAGHDRWPLVVADKPRIYQLPRRSLQIVALPYLDVSWLQQQAPAPDVSPEQQIVGVSGRLAFMLEQLYRQVSPDLPSIFAGHILIGGAHLTDHVEAEVGYSREVWVEPARLPQFTSYNALGHIHLSQQVAGVGKPTWYAGAPERLDLGERDYQPQVLLVTTPGEPGGMAVVEPIPLTTCTPFIDEQLSSPEAVDAFCARLAASNAPDPLGQVVLADIPPAALGPLMKQISTVAPRVQVRWAHESLSRRATRETSYDPHNVRGNVETYLAHRYQQDLEKRKRLEAAFDKIWSELSEEPV